MALISRDLEGAKNAYSAGDVELSISAHGKNGPMVDSPENHTTDANDLVKSLVFGGLDGIITTFAIVAAVAGAGMSTNTIIVMGTANLIADGISMGLGDYISSKAEFDASMTEYNREKWKLENYPEGEYREMIELYEGSGLNSEDAKTLVETMAKYPKFFLDHMFLDELGMLPPDEDAELWKEGLATFLSFVVFGSVPLLTYVIAKAVGGEAEDDVLFIIACGATAFTMFLLGVVKAKLTKSDPFKSGALMLVNGGLAAAAAFGIGWCLEELLVE